MTPQEDSLYISLVSHYLLDQYLTHLKLQVTPVEKNMPVFEAIASGQNHQASGCSVSMREKIPLSHCPLSKLTFPKREFLVTSLEGERRHYRFATSHARCWKEHWTFWSTIHTSVFLENSYMDLNTVLGRHLLVRPLRSPPVQPPRLTRSWGHIRPQDLRLSVAGSQSWLSSDALDDRRTHKAARSRDIIQAVSQSSHGEPWNPGKELMIKTDLPWEKGPSAPSSYDDARCRVWILSLYLLLLLLTSSPVTSTSVSP